MFIRQCCRRVATSTSNYLLVRTLSKKTCGFLVDIDGVLIRGCKTIPGTVEAFHKLSDGRGNLVKPVVFLTNGSYRSEAAKAEELSEKLKVRIHGSQIVLVNTPLQTFTDWHDKSVFFAGQGSSLCSAAKDLGFKNPVILADFDRDLPMFNVMNHRKREALKSGVLPENLPPYIPIEGIVIANTPEDWDGHFQILIDLLLTKGEIRSSNRTSQLPLIACNPDLVWASEYHLPRLACGAFVLMFAALYKDMSGRELEVTWCGKPTKVTYTYALNCLRAQTELLGLELDEVYGIGDNVDVDVVGANNHNITSVLVCTGLYKNNNIDLERNVTVNSKRASVCEPINADIVAKNIGTFIDHILG